MILVHHHLERSKRLKWSLSINYFERSQRLKVCWSTNYLERSERLKGSLLTNYLERSDPISLSPRSGWLTSFNSFILELLLNRDLVFKWRVKRYNYKIDKLKYHYVAKRINMYLKFRLQSYRNQIFLRIPFCLWPYSNNVGDSLKVFQNKNNRCSSTSRFARDNRLTKPLDSLASLEVIGWPRSLEALASLEDIGWVGSLNPLASLE